MAFRVTRRLADEASIPEYQAVRTVRKRPKARMAMVYTQYSQTAPKPMAECISKEQLELSASV